MEYIGGNLLDMAILAAGVAWGGWMVAKQAGHLGARQRAMERVRRCRFPVGTGG